MKWLIYTPNYTNASAGVRLMHFICHLLRQVGEDAAVSCPIVNKEWDPPIRGYEQGDIVIYPEMVFGNPCGADRVVRYVLNTPGLIFGDTKYHPDDLVIAYDEAFRDAAEVAAGKPVPVIAFNALELDLFTCTGDEIRDAAVLYQGKGKAFGLTEDQVNVGYGRIVEITPEWPETRADVAALLRRTKDLYTGDPASMINVEAALCGVTRHLLMEDGTWLAFGPGPQPKYTEIDNEAAIRQLITLVQDMDRRRPVLPNGLPLHFIPYVNRSDLLVQCVESMKAIWSQVIIIDNRDAFTLEPSPDDLFPDGHPLHKRWWKPGFPMSHSQMMSWLVLRAHDMGMTWFTWCHHDCENVDGSIERLIEMAASIEKNGGRSWGVIFTQDPNKNQGRWNHVDVLAAINVGALMSIGCWDWYRFPDVWSDYDAYGKLAKAGYEMIQSGLPINHMQGGSTTSSSDGNRALVKHTLFEHWRHLWELRKEELGLTWPPP